MKYLIFLMIVLFSTSIDSVERPSAVPPPLDDEDNPTYYMAYGKGDRIDPSTNKPLNLIQIYCKEIPVDMATDEQLDECLDGFLNLQGVEVISCRVSCMSWA